MSPCHCQCHQDQDTVLQSKIHENNFAIYLKVAIRFKDFFLFGNGANTTTLTSHYYAFNYQKECLGFCGAAHTQQ